MAKFLAKRLLFALLTLFLVTIVVFLVSQVLPGDIGRTVLGPYAAEDQVKAVDHALGVDRPLPVRYASWLTDFLIGRWGTSYALKVPVGPLVWSRFGHSLILGVFAFLVAVPVSLTAGVVAGLRENGWLDRTLAVVGLSLIAIPEFISGAVLIVIFSVTLRLLPSASGVPTSPADAVRQLLLPAVALGLVLFGYLSRMARAGTVEVVGSDYYRTAVLKGLALPVVVWRHVLRNALTPTIGPLSVQVGWLIGGLVVVETLFNYPGIGQLMLTSAVAHDIPVLEATVVLSAASYVGANLLADTAYGLIDPRLRARS
jgi:peptide/nickel transport system permease protein